MCVCVHHVGSYGRGGACVRVCVRAYARVYVGRSETGVVPDIDESTIDKKGRLGPGQMIALDLETGQFFENFEIKSKVAQLHPYGRWLKNKQVFIKKQPSSGERLWPDEATLVRNQVGSSRPNATPPHPSPVPDAASMHLYLFIELYRHQRTQAPTHPLTHPHLRSRAHTCTAVAPPRAEFAPDLTRRVGRGAQVVFGWSSEDMEMQIADMASTGKETTFCMGDDTPLAVLSEKPHVLFNYFKQRFAQVTAPSPHHCNPLL